MSEHSIAQLTALRASGSEVMRLLRENQKQQAEIERLEAKMKWMQTTLERWERNPCDAMQANPIDTIAANCGWLPLTPGEKMTVHFCAKEYVIERTREADEAAGRET